MTQLCTSEALGNVLKSAGLQVSYLHHRELVKPVTKTSNAWDKLAYYRIANHYKFIFRTFFDCFEYPHVIILEVSHLPAVRDHGCRTPVACNCLPLECAFILLEGPNGFAELYLEIQGHCMT